MGYCTCIEAKQNFDIKICYTCYVRKISPVICVVFFQTSEASGKHEVVHGVVSVPKMAEVNCRHHCNIASCLRGVSSFASEGHCGTSKRLDCEKVFRKAEVSFQTMAQWKPMSPHFKITVRPRKINFGFPLTGMKKLGSVGRDFILFFYFILFFALCFTVPIT